ncbi:thiamine pyrophosphate-binding protein [Microbacterium enclense]|uniref:Acetolactate synthase large subunit n=1 Tax=Microbacterium enclense TaxID=993073 RepID=A0A1G6GZF2_9MICO|nr:thiamine pyrophosphate-binding protein [Microbacterium enclense]KSU55683.1 thiamine pyrophosphate-binding protein [Microbacterium enclense]SDB87427.1 Acetolactate synthase large subunit [Microbacterium enclense]
MPTVSAHVAHTLARHIDTVFGVMGNGNAYFLDALGRDTGSGFVAVRHEAAGVVAADAHYRTCGRLAAATATYGAGFTNTLTALAEAVQARTPLVLIVGDEPTSGPRPWGVDQIALAAAVGARTYTVGHRDAAATIVIAIEHALTYRLPVVVGIPYDVATREAGAIPDATAPGTEPQVTPEHPPLDAYAHGVIDEIVEALASAQRPVLLGGRGAWLAGAGAALDEVAALTGALTTTSALGRGIFSDPARDLGVAGGFGAPGAMRLVHEADVAVVLGAGLNQFTMRFGELFAPGTRVFQIDLAATATHPNVGGYVRGDAADVAVAIAERLRLRGASPSTWGRGLDLAAARLQPEGQGLGPDGRLDPRTAATRLAELLPEDRVVVHDGGHFMGWSNMYWPVASPDRLIMVGTAYQSIGLGFPSVPGAAIARPDATIVLSTGDGGGLMALADLETAIRVAGGRGIAVVWNDAQYGAEVLNYGVKGLHADPMLIPQVDFAAVARGFGAEGVVVEAVDDLDALASWVSRSPEDRGFLLLDLRVSAAVTAPFWEEIASR